MFSQFCKTKPKSGEEEEARIKAEIERKKRANAQITLMDPKTSQNVGIALAKIRLSNEKVRRSYGILTTYALPLPFFLGFSSFRPCPYRLYMYIYFYVRNKQQTAEGRPQTGAGFIGVCDLRPRTLN